MIGNIITGKDIEGASFTGMVLDKVLVPMSEMEPVEAGVSAAMTAYVVAQQDGAILLVNPWCITAVEPSGHSYVNWKQLNAESEENGDQD